MAIKNTMAINTQIQTNNLPSFLDIRYFIEEKPRATICEIRNNFNQRIDENNYFSSIQNINGIERKIVWAFNMTREFAEHLKRFMRESYVLAESSQIACLISDGEIFNCADNEEFIPIVLSIR